MKSRSRFWFVPLLVGLSVVSTAAFGMSNSGDPVAPSLVPELKEVTMHDGGFRLRASTRILVQMGHQEEDRIAAETLAEEVADQSGLKLDIVGTKVSSKAEGNVIMLVRLQDVRVRRFLARKGLTADATVGEEGYLLFSDHSHLIVAANTGEGLFSGVQTLRQLLRPWGKSLICPAVTIRDWPNLQSPANASSISRESTPEFGKRPQS
jgi:hexosaminidase